MASRLPSLAGTHPRSKNRKHTPTSQLGDSLKNRCLVSGRDRIGPIIYVAHGPGKGSRSDRPNTPGSVLVQECITANGHFNFRSLDQIHGGIEPCEFLQSVGGVRVKARDSERENACVRNEREPYKETLSHPRGRCRNTSRTNVKPGQA